MFSQVNHTNGVVNGKGPRPIIAKIQPLGQPIPSAPANEPRTLDRAERFQLANRPPTAPRKPQ